MRHGLLILLATLLIAPLAWAAEVIPPSPAPHYIVDEAHILSPALLDEVDRQLAQFEKETTNQIVVGVYPKMQSEDEIAAYAVRVYDAWKPGQKDKNNGVLLLIFTQDHKLNITTGYGLEGALPDATAHEVIANVITPKFKANDYDGGVRAGIASIISATKGEYKPAEPPPLGTIETIVFCIIVLIIFVGPFAVVGFLIYLAVRSIRRGRTFSSGRSRLSSSSSDSGWSSSSSSCGGGSSSSGGFSGGGGETGGGGASGSW